MEVRIMDILKAGLDRDDVEGVVVNPFDKPFVFRENMLGHFIGNMEYISKRYSLIYRIINAGLIICSGVINSYCSRKIRRTPYV